MANIKVDELIKEYVVYRAENDYKTKFTVSEFMKFLEYFKTKEEVDDTLEDGFKMFKRFFERECDWKGTPYYDKVHGKGIPSNEHAMIFEFSEEDNDYVLRTGNYLYSSYGASIWHVYWNIEKARRIMEEYLINEPKRTIDENINYTEEELLIGKSIAAKMMSDIWYDHIDYLINNHTWPSQCRDFNKYFLKTDLALVIGVDSIRDSLFELYNTVSKRIAILYHQDKDLFISTNGSLVGQQNYKLISKGFERIMGFSYGEFKKELKIDVKELNISESYEDGASYWDCKAPVITSNSNIVDDRVKSLVLSIEKCLSKE